MKYSNHLKESGNCYQDLIFSDFHLKFTCSNGTSYDLDLSELKDIKYGNEMYPDQIDRDNDFILIFNGPNVYVKYPKFSEGVPEENFKSYHFEVTNDEMLLRLFKAFSNLAKLAIEKRAASGDKF